MQPHPHDVDVKALLRIAVLYNVPIGCNRATADFIMSSPLLNETYKPQPPDLGGGAVEPQAPRKSKVETRPCGIV